MFSLNFIVQIGKPCINSSCEGGSFSSLWLVSGKLYIILKQRRKSFEVFVGVWEVALRLLIFHTYGCCHNS